MDVELLEVHDFLAQHRPFDALPGERLRAIARVLRLRYERKGALILDAGARNDTFFMVRSGAVEVREGGTDLTSRLVEGEYFGYRSLLRDGVTRNSVRALEDTLLICLDAAVFRRLIDEEPMVARYFAMAEADRLRAAMESFHRHHLGHDETRLVSARVGDLGPRRAVVACGGDTPVAEVARRMAAADVSTMLVTDADGALAGIFTDKDLRRRVVGKGLALDRPVAEVMTPQPVTMAAEATALEALLAMTKRNIHHIPVVDADADPVAVISANDLLSQLSGQALYVTARIEKAEDPAAVAEAARATGASLLALVEAGAPPQAVGHFVSSIGEAVHRRLAQLAEAELGPPPVPYALLVFGSLAREDQSARSDQDNGLLIDDAYDVRAHGGYFEALGRRICDGLDAAGYPYCKGGIMASNPDWRLPLSGWQRTFARWITEPEPKSIMNATIFFDHRAVHGEVALMARLRDHVLGLAHGDTIFLAHMTQDALRASVPLGFFRKLVLIKDKEHKDSLNLKRQGIMPITDIARVYALASGSPTVNTRERLAAAVSAGLLAASDGADLTDAWDFVAGVRLKHQAAQVRAGETADNFVSPGALSRFERDHLRDAFALIRQAQNAIGFKFARGIMS
ncbi:CBS domain-containing protein [Rhodothalassium salexigens DSM 2132]|uniref:CBS domain-containing protein n=1 Tax=Rhodothalassium salexigens DSM 2132 TaxID=1188247 RepID=A0A4R2PDQ3_RHOSA|nr:putative nucleotidyltransferase substrate binding domain-containing protein [Rhodothalassium salexigens]MBB4212271.1 CBS domain-containing protein [Rhodothalassium salexigens DSM 2132]TCP32578.1 CBS domain-containing protein [Rhodothalassium salexigens DSM 2132]